LLPRLEYRADLHIEKCQELLQRFPSRVKKRGTGKSSTHFPMNETGALRSALR